MVPRFRRTVRMCAWMLLGLLAPVAAQTPPKGPPAEVIAEAFTAISRRDPYPVVALLARADTTPELRSAALRLLADLGMPATAALVRVGDRAASRARPRGSPSQAPRHAARRPDRLDLGTSGFDEAMRADDLRFGGKAVVDGGRIPDSAATATLFGSAHFVPFLKDGRPDVRASAAAALARYEHPADFRILASMLAEVDPASGAAALEAIAECLPKGALEAALPHLASEDEGRLSGAIAVIAALGARSRPTSVSPRSLPCANPP
jgi:HEAT repeat protein